MNTSKLMKVSLLLASLAITSHTRAATILTDSFDVTGTPDTTNINYNIPARQTGSSANTTWTGSGNAQAGNPTDVGQPGGASNGNFLLLAFGASASLNLPISSSNVDSPLLISFDMYNGSTAAGGDSGDWTSFSLTTYNTLGNPMGPGNAGWPVVGGPNFGFLKRQNGTEGEVFSSGGSGAVTFSGDSFSLLLTDTAGTGSAFTGNGTKIKFMNGLTEIGTYSLDTNMTTTYLTFGVLGTGGFPGLIGGVDNLNIQTVPEPASWVLLAFSLTTVLAFRRRRVA